MADAGSRGRTLGDRCLDPANTALAAGVPVLVSPAVGDMAENGARVSWSGTGEMLPRRLLSPQSLRLATRRLLRDPSYGLRATELAAWAKANDGADTAADLLERRQLRGWDSNPQPIG